MNDGPFELENCEDIGHPHHFKLKPICMQVNWNLVQFVEAVQIIIAPGHFWLLGCVPKIHSDTNS